MVSSLSAYSEDFLHGKDLNLKTKITKIALGSCFNQDAPAPIWATLLKLEPDLYLGMGDNIYASTPLQRPIRDQYLKFKKNPDLKQFFEKVPFLTTWDDHDYGLNDGGKENADFDEAKKAYLGAFQVDARMIPSSQHGVEHSVILGDSGHRIQVILLDTRSYRDPWKKALIPLPGKERYEPTEDTSKTLLGTQQWQWLEAQFDQPAEVRVLVSSIQFLAQGHGYERWGLMPHEQKQLENLLIKKKIKKLILLSGDRHLGEIFHKKITENTQLVEMTSSGLNKSSNIIDETEPLRIGKLHSVINFGLITIDWSQNKVTLTLRDEVGTILESFSI